MAKRRKSELCIAPLPESSKRDSADFHRKIPAQTNFPTDTSYTGATNVSGGTLLLTGNNSLTGTTTISNGLLQVGNGGGTGALGSGNIVDNAALAFNLNSSTTLSLPAGSAISGSGNLTATAEDIQFNGNISLSGSQAYSENGGGSLYTGLELVAASTTLTGSSITLSGDVGKRTSAGNSLSLSTSAVNGPINLNISLGRTNVWYSLASFTATAGTGTINVTGTGPGSAGWNSTPVTLAGGVNITANVNSAAAVTINPTAPSSVSGVLSGAMPLTAGGPGLLTLSGSNTYSGMTTISTGTLVIGGGGVLGNGSYAAAIANSGALVMSSSSNQTLSGAITGPGSLTMNGNSILTLGTAANTFSGGTTINAGTLTITSAGSNTASALGVGQSVTVGSGAELRLAATDALGYYGGNPSSLTINGGTMTVATGIHDSVLDYGATLNAGTITSEGAGDATGNYILDGNVTTLANANPSVISPQTIYLRGYGSGGTITFNVAHGAAVPDLLVSAAMSQAIPIVKTGAGLMELTGTNSYSTTTISGGTLQVGNGGASGTLGTGNVTDNATLVFSRSDSGLNVAAAISGSGGVFQNGGGTTTISALPSYTGDTTVNAGKISFANAATWAMAGNIFINGGMFDLAGGTRQVSMAAGKAVSFGPAGGGTLSLNSVNFYQNSGTMSISTAGGAQSQIVAAAAFGNVGINANGLPVSFNLARGSDPAVNLNVAAPVWNTGSVLLGGNGILELSANNSYNGGTTINGGTLQVGGGGASGTLGTGPVINNGTLAFNRSDTGLNVAGAISGSGGVNQNGSGATFLSASNSYTGPTNVNAGGLYVNGSLPSSGTVNVAGGAMLGGTGSVGQAFVAGGGIIDASGALSGSGTNTFTLAGLSFSGNGTINVPTLTSTASLVVQAGSLTVGGGSGSVGFAFPYTVIGSGLYRLLAYSGGTIGGTGYAAFTVAQPPVLGARQSGSLVNNSGEIDYSVVGTTPYWNGQQSDWLATNAWTLQPSGSQATFIPGDNDIFDDTASSGGVSINQGNVAPISVFFNNNTLAYSLSGAYGVSDGTAGATILVKNGSGSLTIATSNGYSGGTQFNAGTLNINNPSALGGGTLTISGGTLGNTSGGLVTLATNNPQSWNGDFAFSGPNDLNLGTGAVTLGGSRTVTVAGGNLTVGGPIGGAGFGLTKAGPGNLVLGGANTYNAGTLVLGGTLTAANDAALSTGPVTMSPSSGMAVLAFTSGSPAIASLASGGAGSSSIVLGNAAAGSPTTLTIGGNNLATTFGGTIGDLSASNSAAVGSLVKTGSGTLTLNGIHTFTGPTVVNQGVLQLNNAANLSNDGLYASSSITVNSGGEILVNQTNALQGWGSTAGSLAINAGGLVTTSNGVTSHIRGPLVLSGGTLASGTANGTYGSWAIDYDVTVNGATTSTMSGVQMNWTGTRTFTVSSAGGTLNVPGTFAYPSGMTGALVKAGPGMMVLSNANNYTGGTTVNGGTLAVAYDNAQTGTLPSGQPVTVNAGATLQMNAADALGYYSGNPSVIYLNGGRFTTNGGAFHDSLGAFNLTAGTITAPTTGDSGGLNYIFDGTTTTNSASNASVISTPGSIYLRGGSTANAALTFNVALGSGPIDLLVTSPLLNGNGTNGLIKSGAGLMELTASNTYTGGTTVSGGTLLLAHAGAGNDYFDSNAISIAGGATFAISQTSGSVRYSSVSKTISGAGTLAKTGSALTYLANDSGSTISTVNLSAGGLISVQAGTLASIQTAATNLGGLTIAAGATATLDNNATQGANGWFDALNGGGSLQYDAGTAARTITLGLNNGGGSFSGSIANGGTGPVSLAKTGTGTQVLSGTNTYTGGTTVNSGILQLGSTAALGSGGLTAGGGTLDLASYSPVVASLSGPAGTITNSGPANASLTVNQATASTFSGVIIDGANQPNGPREDGSWHAHAGRQQQFQRRHDRQQRHPATGQFGGLGQRRTDGQRRHARSGRIQPDGRQPQRRGGNHHRERRQQLHIDDQSGGHDDLRRFAQRRPGSATSAWRRTAAARSS